MSKIKCKGCQYEPSEYDTLSGYCLTCADKRVKEYDKLKASHTKLIDIAILSKSIIGNHMKYHADNNTLLCKNCKATIEDATKRIEQVLKEAEKI